MGGGATYWAIAEVVIVKVAVDAKTDKSPHGSLLSPATVQLFATGLGVLGLLGWRRKQKLAAYLATAP